MRLGNLVTAAAIAALLTGAPATASAGDDVKAAARAGAAKAAKSIVTVKLVVKVKMGGARGGRDQEQKLEILGTVIDPAGLTVVSASSIDPVGALGGAMRRGGRGGGAGGAEGMPQIETEVGETMLVLEDGTEVEADVVLKDADLDLAFVRPREAQKLDAVTLKPRGKPLELLEDIFAVTRLGRGDARSPAVAVGSVRSVVKGPRTYYICTPEVADGNQGCIAYGADGAPAGIFVVKVNASAEGGAGFGRGGGGRGGMASIVLRPIEDMLDLAKQAKEAKAPERKPVAETPPAPEGEKKDGEKGASATPPAAPTAPTAPAPASGEKKEEPKGTPR